MHMDNRRKVEPRAIYIGLATFSVLYIGLIILGNLFGDQPFTKLVWLQFILLTTSGYVAGRIARLNGLLNGLMVGLVSPIALSIGMSLATMQIDIATQVFSALGVFWLIQSVVLCSLGGFIWDLQAKMTSKKP